MTWLARTALLITSLSAASAAAALDVVLTPFAGGFDRPVVVTHAGDSRLFVVEKTGYIRVVQSDGTVLPTPFLDVHSDVSSGNEQGLLGLVFHPDYGSNGFFYIYYTDASDDVQVKRYTVSGNPDVANAGSALPVLSVPHPFSNHNGGDMHFGPDGYLYIGVGDGGGGCDPGDESQDGTSLLGKMLRIDVDSGSPYAIPASNPYAGPDGIADEIWALGLRNPWRFSFDRLTGDLWIGDVGQNAFEEIDLQPAASSGGQNYGWDCREGFASASDASGCSTVATCMPLSLFVEPVHDYSHGDGCSITGGYRYRGSASAALSGMYLFSDYCAGEIRALTTSDGGTTWNAQSLGTPVANLFPTAFGEDAAGELYVASDGGTIYRVTLAADAPPCPTSPSSGCAVAGKAKLNAKRDGDASKNKLLWKWSADSSSADLGDPTGGTAYRLCLYAGTASVDLSVGVASGASWRATGSGFSFKDPSAAGDGAFKMLLKGSPGGKSKLLLKAKGANLDLDALPLGLTSQPLVTQLIRNDDPTCWEATFPTLGTDDGSKLKAKTP